jgi:hypothetical protein
VVVILFLPEATNGEGRRSQLSAHSFSSSGPRRARNKKRNGQIISARQITRTIGHAISADVTAMDDDGSA